jgi:hypothetical protein
MASDKRRGGANEVGETSAGTTTSTRRVPATVAATADPGAGASRPSNSASPRQHRRPPD